MDVLSVAAIVLVTALLAIAKERVRRRLVPIDDGTHGPGWRTVILLLSVFCAVMATWTGAVEREFLWMALWMLPLPVAAYVLLAAPEAE